MAGCYIFNRGNPTSKGDYMGNIRAKRLMKLLKKQKIKGVCYKDFSQQNPSECSWKPIIEISWR